MWTWLQVLPSSQARKRECFSLLSCQSPALTQNQSGSLKMYQSTWSPSQGWSFHHPQQCPKYWKFVNLVITGNGCDCKGLERAQVMWEKRRKKNNADPSPKISWQSGPTLCSAEPGSEMKSCPVLPSLVPLQTLQLVQCDRGQVTVTLGISSEELDFKSSQTSAKDWHAQVLKKELIWNQLNLFLLPLPLKG